MPQISRKTSLGNCKHVSVSRIFRNDAKWININLFWKVLKEDLNESAGLINSLMWFIWWQAKQFCIGVNGQTMIGHTWLYRQYASRKTFPANCPKHPSLHITPPHFAHQLRFRFAVYLESDAEWESHCSRIQRVSSPDTEHSREQDHCVTCQLRNHADPSATQIEMWIFNTSKITHTLGSTSITYRSDMKAPAQY